MTVKVKVISISINKISDYAKDKQFEYYIVN